MLELFYAIVCGVISMVVSILTTYFILRERVVRLEMRSENTEKRQEEQLQAINDFRKTMHELNVTLAGIKAILKKNI
jgi:Na+/melibiose symporter-like transporter